MQRLRWVGRLLHGAVLVLGLALITQLAGYARFGQLGEPLAFTKPDALSAVATDSYVEGAVALRQTPVVRFSRWGKGSCGIYQVEGLESGWVEHCGPGLDGPRGVLPKHVLGRLVRLEESGWAFAGARAGLGERGWVIVDGFQPRSAGWALTAIGLIAVFMLVSLVSLSQMWGGAASKAEALKAH